MSQNIQQIFVANPASSMVSTDLLYLGRSPYNTTDDFAITFANFVASIGTATPTASTIPRWDAHVNMSANSFIEGYTTIATSAGTSTLTVASPYLNYFTGTTTQTVVLPVTSTLVLGQQFFIANNSTGVVTVQSSGLNNIVAMAANTVATFTVISTTGTTATSWSTDYNSTVAGVNSITGTANQVIASASTGAVVLSLPQSIAPSSAVNFASMQLSNIGVLDANGNGIIALSATASAVNSIAIFNAATSSAPSFQAVGSDTNININLISKGTGGIGITGVSDGSSASAGFVGELLYSANATGVAQTSSVTTTIQSLTLTPGDWDVWGVYYTTVGGSTIQFFAEAALNPVAATLSPPTTAQLASFAGAYGTVATGVSVYLNLGLSRWNVTSNTTVYLCANSSYTTSTLTGNGAIYARRIR